MKTIKAKMVYGTHSIAKICHVTAPTVARWIEEGKLPSSYTGGGHRRVQIEDLLIFLKQHKIRVPNDIEPNQKLKILVVDDEPEVRKVIARMVHKKLPEYEISAATNGFEAGIMMSTIFPSLVLLDLHLPGINGLEVCELIRSDNRFNGTKILAMTGFNIEEAKNQLLKAGANDFIAKPFKIEDLTNKIYRLISEEADSLQVLNIKNKLGQTKI